MAAVSANIYNATELARLAGLNISRVQRWLSGYSVHAGTPKARRIAPLVLREKGADGPAASFNDLLEVLFIKTFLKHGVKISRLRKAADNAKSMLETSHPFSLRKFQTDGRTVFAEFTNEGKGHLVDLPSKQQAFETMVRPYFRHLDYEDDIVARWWPMGQKGRVVVDPRRSFGQPIDATSGVPTRVLYSAVLAGQTQAEVAKWFEVPVQSVRAAVKFERTLETMH
jgi:uncharacterized protein (DUF433 family)